MKGWNYGDVIFNKAEPKVEKRRNYFHWADEETICLTTLIPRFWHEDEYRGEDTRPRGEDIFIPAKDHQLVNLSQKPLKIGDIVDDMYSESNYIVVGFYEDYDQEGDMTSYISMDGYPRKRTFVPGWNLKVGEFSNRFRLSSIPGHDFD